jgi:hypothetical protein
MNKEINKEIYHIYYPIKSFIRYKEKELIMTGAILKK